VADLITVPDLTARLGPLTAEQTARAPALIGDASALARLESGQQFSVVTGDVVVLRINGNKLQLPGKPVLTVTSVVAIGIPPSGDLTLPPGTWVFDGIDKIIVGLDTGWVINFPEDWQEGCTGSYRVTYDHGWATVPPEIVATVAGMVARVLTAPSKVEGLTGENIGQYGYQMAQAGGNMGASVRVTAADRAVFRDPKFRRTTRTIETPIG
jgi:hypothetical protein